ncbi:MAG TPA: lipid A export permease/ATP-binding protein MsbA [Steroidobacteraceae bacterium]|nr:lipid A export permease/ATP-binding protein MsbA [Steroidobacteraceae bacterium]
MGREADRRIDLKMPRGAMQTYRRLLGYLRPHKGMFAVGVLGMTLFAATDAGWAAFVKFFLDGTFVDKDPRMVWLVPVALVGLFVLRGVSDFMQTYCPGYVGRRVVKTLRAQIFDRYVHLPVAYFDRNPSGMLLSKLTYNTEQVANATTDSVTVFIRDSLTILGLVGYLLYMNPRLTLFSLIVGPLIAALIRRINQLFRRYSRRIQHSMGDVTRVAKEAIEAPRVIRVFNAQEYEARMFDEVIEHNRRSHMKLMLTKGLSNPIVQTIAATGLAGVLYLATVDAIAGRMTVGEFTSFIAALMLITAPLRRLVNVAGPLQQGIAAAQSIFDVLDTPVENVGGGHRVARARGEVEYRDVGFQYPASTDPVLHGVSLHARPGETIAIVGRSGSGKSTLVGLLPRFYDATSGQVLVDGVDVREYALDALRGQMSLVSQDVVLFNDTIRSNIASGHPADASQIDAAARAARVTEFSDQFPLGLDTVVGDRGALLSGGQRQRIAIARALLRNTPILILDEATSALDTELEREVQQQLEALMANRTTLVIAHRLSTVEKADRILVVEAGRVIESGPHQELVARGGQYSVLHRLQFSE